MKLGLVGLGATTMLSLKIAGQKCIPFTYDEVSMRRRIGQKSILESIRALRLRSRRLPRLGPRVGRRGSLLWDTTKANGEEGATNSFIIVQFILTKVFSMTYGRTKEPH